MQFRQRPVEFAGVRFDDEFVAADFADLHCRNAHQLRALDHLHRVQRFARDDHAAFSFAKEQGVRPDIWEGWRAAVPEINKEWDSNMLSLRV